MPRKSALKEVKCLVASFKPVMLMQNDDPMKEAQNIEGLYRYVIELFNGISRNESNGFSGKFDYSISLTPMIFTDENIYPTGNVSERTLIISKEGIIWGTDEEIDVNEISVCVEKTLADKYDKKYVALVADKVIVDFLPMVYRFNTFKEEKGNMMRHIVNPINSVRKGNEELLSNLITYCQNYIQLKKFDLEL